jgi:hypothetical protein
MGRPLNVFAPEFRDNQYTYAIYWRQRGGYDSIQNGHAALIIDSSRFTRVSANWYVSWIGTGPSSNFGTVIEMGTHRIDFLSDARSYGGELGPLISGIQYYLPRRWVALQNLDIDAMKQAWDDARTKQGAHWKLLNKNCATMAARILKAGGGDDFARKHSQQVVWWPTDVIKYAKSMGASVVESSYD